MAIVVTDPALLKVSTTGGSFEPGTAGEAISSGDWLYRDASRTYFLAKCDDPDKATLYGVAMNNAILGGTVYVNRDAAIEADAVFAKDVVYVLSATAGRIAPEADLVSGNLISIAGVASSTTGLKVGILNTGIAKT